MADLFVHYGVGHALGRPLARVEDRATLVLGNFLPDLAHKLLYWAGGATTWFAEPAQTPLVLPVVAALAAFFFAAPYRARAFGLLLVGSALHLLVDAGKDYVGYGVVLWAFPFSFDRVEFGLYVAGDVWPQWAFAAGLVVAAEIVARRWRRRGHGRPATERGNAGSGSAAGV